MKDKVRIGVIGAGQIGTAHLNGYSLIPEVQVVAVSDLFEKKVTTAKEKFSIPDGYADFRDLLKRDDIDAVDVCVHNNKHAPIAIAALEAGKNVWCEKPMAGTFRDAHNMFQAAKKAGRKLHIQMDTVFCIESRGARKLIAEGALGKIY